MHALSEGFKSHVLSENWDSIAQMALSFQVQLSRDDKHAKRLRKELMFIKHILYENTRTPERADKFVNTAFFVRLFRTVDKLEKAFERHAIERTEFLAFLQAVLHKLKRERVTVHKPLERKHEFRRMKDVGLP